VAKRTDVASLSFVGNEVTARMGSAAAPMVVPPYWLSQRFLGRLREMLALNLEEGLGRLSGCSPSPLPAGRDAVPLQVLSDDEARL
jgi:hypothetical protein